MALAKTWRWRIIATWICERKAKSCGGITSLSFCFSFSKTRTRLSSEMQSSPSLGWITVFWIKTWLQLDHYCDNLPNLRFNCPSDARARSEVSGMVWKFPLIAGNIVTNSQAKRDAVRRRQQRGPLSLPSTNGASSTVCLRPTTAHRSITGFWVGFF